MAIAAKKKKKENCNSELSRRTGTRQSSGVYSVLNHHWQVRGDVKN